MTSCFWLVLPAAKLQAAPGVHVDRVSAADGFRGDKGRSLACMVSARLYYTRFPATTPLALLGLPARTHAKDPTLQGLTDPGRFEGNDSRGPSWQPRDLLRHAECNEWHTQAVELLSIVMDANSAHDHEANSGPGDQSMEYTSVAQLRPDMMDCNLQVKVCSCHNLARASERIYTADLFAHQSCSQTEVWLAPRWWR